MPRFDIAAYSKEQKRLREKVLMENRNLKSLQNEISVMVVVKEEKKKELCSIKEKYLRLDNKV